MNRNLITRSTTTSSGRSSFLSRAITRRGEQEDGSGSGDKGPLGLTTLYKPDPDVLAIADIVFVHGLNGGSFSTWTKGNNRDTHFWPREWLPKDVAFRDVRIHTFGYPSAVRRESILNVHDFARSLLAAVKDSPSAGQGNQARIIFVAHSMGGLVVKKAFVLGHHEDEFKPLIDRTSAIVFLATPHRGAAIAQTLSRLMTLVPGQRPFIDDLLPQSPMLQMINEDFPRFCQNIQLLSFYETRPMTVGLNKMLIVDKESAVMELPNERRTLLDADHRNVAMYSSSEDAVFVSVRNALATVVSTHRSSFRSQAETAEEESKEAIDAFLGVSDPPDDDIMTQNSKKLPGSCEWVSSNPYYRAWRSLDSRFLWFRGRPGAGKSVLSAHVVNDLREAGEDTCFFFFRSEDNAKSTVNAWLRSMAWQAAMFDPGVMAKLRQVMAETKSEAIDRVDPNPVWRKVFLSGILKVKLERPQFWVIDALDECKGSADMMEFLARVQSQWPVSVMVTCRNPKEAHENNTNQHVDIQSYTISEEDVNRDIALLVKSNIDSILGRNYMPTLDSPDLASEIVDKAHGCFLWASLICSELRNVTTEKGREAVMNSIPSDMDFLYTKILEGMSSSRFDKDLAKGFITWTHYAFRPLTTFEIQEPLEMDMNDKINDIEHSINRCCGSMIYVDTKNNIRFVHATAREFLKRKDVETEFAVPKADGHCRLAMVCLRYLMQGEKPAPKARRLNSISDAKSERSTAPRARTNRLRSDPGVFTAPNSTLASFASPASFPSFANPTPTGAFTEYASMFLFPHLNQVHTRDDAVFEALSKFLGSPSCLRWIEFMAERKSLHTVYQAGKIINSLMGRRAQHSPPPGLAFGNGQRKFAMLERWGDDLIHLVTKFSRWLLRCPHSIHHLIPPFCPANSAIREQFVTPFKGINVQGLADREWDDCLTTIHYAKGMRPQVLAAGPGYFAVGMMSIPGKVIVYDDAIFQEMHALLHGEPVFALTFSESGEYLASAGSKKIRLWSSETGELLLELPVPARCLALSFIDDDRILRAVTKQNQLFEWDLEQLDPCPCEPITWTADLPETIQGRVPTTAAFCPWSDVLCIIYRGEDMILWDSVENSLDYYDKVTGSVHIYDAYKVAEGATTVEAIAISRGIDTNRLAAIYQDGDLVVYDMESRAPIATAGRINTTRISSSNDGRTLAGVDSYGNLTLFEFDTLRVLYRIQFDVQQLPRDMTFSSDSLRFMEIRGDQCRIWGPTVLLRTDTSEEENSDTVSVASMPHEVDYQAKTAAHITALAACKTTNAVFCGMDDGTVRAYDISGEPVSKQLFVHHAGCAVTVLHVDEAHSILACFDLSGRLTARKVPRKGMGRQATWDVPAPLLDTTAPALGIMRQIVVSGQQSRLLACGDKFDTLWPMPKEGEGVWKAQVQGHNAPRWLPHPTQPEFLVQVTPARFSLHRWSDLSEVRSVSVAPDVAIDHVVSLSHRQYFATMGRAAPTGASGADKGKQQSCVQLWSFADLETAADTAVMAPVSQLSGWSDNVDRIIGSFGVRMVVYTADNWIASVELGASAESTFVRHFFVPGDWVSDKSSLFVDVGRNGEILFTRHSELAVIKRGLETTESGATFNPRRPSSAYLTTGGLPSRRRSRSPRTSISSISSVPDVPG